MEITTRPHDMEKIRKGLEQAGATIASAEVAMVPKTSAPLDESTAIQVLKLLDKLEELDDVQHVSSNADFPPEVLEKYQSLAD